MQISIYVGVVIALAIFALYMLRGVKKYDVISFVKLFSKKEKAASVLATFLFLFMLLICSSHKQISFDGGTFTEVAAGINCHIFGGNEAISSFFFLIVLLVTTVFYQSMIASRLGTMMKQSYTRFFYYLMMYVLNPAIYILVTATVGTYAIALLLSVEIYSVMVILTNKLGKKEIILSCCMLLIIITLIALEKNVNYWLLLVFPVTMCESVVLSVYLDRALILRKGIKYLGTLVLIAILMGVNYFLFCK